MLPTCGCRRTTGLGPAELLPQLSLLLRADLGHQHLRLVQAVGRLQQMLRPDSRGQEVIGHQHCWKVQVLEHLHVTSRWGCVVIRCWQLASCTEQQGLERCRWYVEAGTAQERHSMQG